MKKSSVAVTFLLVASGCGGITDTTAPTSTTASAPTTTVALTTTVAPVATQTPTSTVAPTTTAVPASAIAETTTTAVPATAIAETTTTAVPATAIAETTTTTTVVPAATALLHPLSDLMESLVIDEVVEVEIGTQLFSEDFSALGNYGDLGASQTMLTMPYLQDSEKLYATYRARSYEGTSCSINNYSVTITSEGSCIVFVYLVPNGKYDPNKFIIDQGDLRVFLLQGRTYIPTTTTTSSIPPPVTTVAPSTTTVVPTTTLPPVVVPTTTLPPVVVPTTTLLTAVVPSTEATSANERFFDLVRVTETWNLGYTGAGSVVAVIDGSGFDISHPDFAGNIVAEVCIADSGAEILCPGGLELTEGEGASVNWPGRRHGTGVAGVVQQFAPDTGFVFIHVSPGEDGGTQGTHQLAYDWVVDNTERYGIDVLVQSMSRRTMPRADRDRDVERVCSGAGAFGEFEAGADSKSIAAMRALGVAPVFNSGNDGYLNYVNPPSCYEHSVSVGAVTEFGKIEPYSNVGEYLTFLAPTDLTAATISENGVYERFSGTSGAAPVVGALIAIGRQIKPDATVDELIAAARATGRSIDDYEVKDLRLVDFLAFSQTLAGLPVSPKNEAIFDIDAVTSLRVGVGAAGSDLISIGGFRFGWDGGRSFRISRISGSDSVCIEERGGIVGVGPGTCLYSIKLAPYDSATQEVVGPYETKVIQFDVISALLE